MERGDEERALDITYEQGQRLFYVSAWPNKFGDKFQDSGKKQDARIAAARIEHFIRTKGKE